MPWNFDNWNTFFSDKIKGAKTFLPVPYIEYYHIKKCIQELEWLSSWKRLNVVINRKYFLDQGSLPERKFFIQIHSLANKMKWKWAIFISVDKSNKIFINPILHFNFRISDMRNGRWNVDKAITRHQTLQYPNMFSSQKHAGKQDRLCNIKQIMK